MFFVRSSPFLFAIAGQTFEKKQSSVLFWQTALMLWSTLPLSLIVRFSAWRLAVESN
jgi:hypothetical protein